MPDVTWESQGCEHETEYSDFVCRCVQGVDSNKTWQVQIGVRVKRPDGQLSRARAFNEYSQRFDTLEEAKAFAIAEVDRHLGREPQV